MKPAEYTEEQREWMKQYVPGHSYKEIAEAFQERFWDITVGQVKTYIRVHGLNTGRTGHFKKGAVPHNKGKKMTPDVYEKCKATMFEKGHKPVNYRPVGSERINVEGYIEIKVKDPATWKLKHVWVYEQHNGPVPKSHIVTFRDGNCLNCDISNLILMSRNEHLIMARKHLFGYKDDEKEVAINIARMIAAGTKARKKRNGE